MMMKNNKVIRVKMRMIKMKMERTILFFLITTYHFEEEAGESINIRTTGFSSK